MEDISKNPHQEDNPSISTEIQSEAEPLQSEAEPLQNEAEPLQSETELLKEQVKKEQDKYFRALADMENSRKRMQKDKLDSSRFAVENVINEFLSPLDNFENALSFAHQTSEETQNWAKGFDMILTQFKDILANHNIVPYQSEGTQFDPHLHEVIEMAETEKYEDGVIIQEFTKGYKCGDRILRPARVKVAKSVTKLEKEKESKENNQGDS